MDLRYMLTCIEEMQECHMSVHHGDTVMGHNDTKAQQWHCWQTEILLPETIYKRVSGESPQPFIFYHLLLSSVSVCWEDELGMAEALHRLLVKGKGGGREGGEAG